MVAAEAERYWGKLVAAEAERGRSKLAIEAERGRSKLVAAEID
jgi:hypothetical protein